MANVSYSFIGNSKEDLVDLADKILKLGVDILMKKFLF